MSLGQSEVVHQTRIHVRIPRPDQDIVASITERQLSVLLKCGFIEVLGDQLASRPVRRQKGISDHVRVVVVDQGKRVINTDQDVEGTTTGEADKPGEFPSSRPQFGYKKRLLMHPSIFPYQEPPTKIPVSKL